MAELSLSLNGSAQQVNIPNIDAQNRNPYDSFPSIPDVNASGLPKQGTTVNQSLDGFTINSINLNKVNKKNHDRLANLQQKQNLNYKESDPKDELAQLDELLFSMLKSDQNDKSIIGKRDDTKQNAINMEQQVRGMIQHQSKQVGGGRGLAFNDKEHSLRSFEAENQIYRDQMNEIFNQNALTNNNNNSFQLHQNAYASQTQKYDSPTQKALKKLPKQDILNIDSFIMADTHKLDSLKGITFKNEDSMQGINTMSLQGGRQGGASIGNSKNFQQQRQNTISSIRGSVAGGGIDLDSIDEAPEENSLKVISDALSGSLMENQKSGFE